MGARLYVLLGVCHQLAQYSPHMDSAACRYSATSPVFVGYSADIHTLVATSWLRAPGTTEILDWRGFQSLFSLCVPRGLGT